MVVVRYLTDGTLDADFASEGIWVHQVSPLNDQVSAVIHRPDGKLVVIGSARIGVPSNATSRFAIVRLLEDGTLDGSFGTDGISLLSVGTGHAMALSGLIQPDGLILATGFSGYPTLVTTIRCLQDGSLDLTFGSDGVVTTYVAAESANSKDLVIQPDGKILVTSECWEGTGQFYTALLRYTSAGVLDESFASSGIAVTSFPDRSIIPEAVALQPDGKPLVVGHLFQGTLTESSSLRFLNDLDVGIPSFDPQVERLFVFPNPAVAQLTLQYELTYQDRISLHVMDGTGRIIRTPQTNSLRTVGLHHEVFDVSGLASGHYTLSLVGRNNRMQVPLIID